MLYTVATPVLPSPPPHYPPQIPAPDPPALSAPLSQSLRAAVAKATAAAAAGKFDSTNFVSWCPEYANTKQCGKAWTIASDCQVRRCKLRPKGSAGGDGKCGSKLKKEWMKETLITKKLECPSTEQVKAAYMRLKDSKKHDDKATCVGTDAITCGVASDQQIKYTVCNSQEEESAPCDKKKFDCATGFTRTSRGLGGWRVWRDGAMRPLFRPTVFDGARL